MVYDKSITKEILYTRTHTHTTEDSCHYAGDPAHLEEYVLNNHGKIWVGSSYNNYGRPWQFAQFKKDSLDVALWAMDKMQQFDRGDPIKVRQLMSGGG